MLWLKTLEAELRRRGKGRRLFVASMLTLFGTAILLELVAWEQRRSVLLDWAENGSGRLSVNPDALFGLKDREKPEGQNTTYFFLEIVRSRESDYRRGQSYFMRKMEALD